MPAKPKSPFPNPAATLPGEADVLANVLADLSDHDAKLVYADWLEEHDDKRGPFLRNFITAYRAGKKLPALKGAPKAWIDLVGLALIAKLHSTDLGAQTDQILALARPTIGYETARAAEKTIPLGTSKFGGGPDLPPGAEWPCFGETPLAFLGQFNLAELRPSPVARELPASGLLSAFCRYDEDDGNDDFPKGTWALLYFPDTEKLTRSLPPEPSFASCRLEFAEALTLPKWGSPWEKELAAIGITEYGEPYSDVYYDLAPGDHILGHPYPIQGDYFGTKKSARHLLTIGGNDQTGWGFGDGGALYFILNENDLKQGRFDRVKMFMDCG